MPDPNASEGKKPARADPPFSTEKSLSEEELLQRRLDWNRPLSERNQYGFLSTVEHPQEELSQPVSQVRYRSRTERIARRQAEKEEAKRERRRERFKLASERRKARWRAIEDCIEGKYTALRKLVLWRGKNPRRRWGASNWEWNITLDEWKRLWMVASFQGIVFSMRGREMTKAKVERIDPKLPYSIDNIRIREGTTVVGLTPSAAALGARKVEYDPTALYNTKRGIPVV